MDKPKPPAVRRPRMGKVIISEKQARLLANKTVEEESFLNDPSISEPSMEESYRRPTLEEMRAAVRRNNEERAAEFRAIGRTGNEGLGDLPPIGFKMPARVDTSSDSESEMSANEDNKENSVVNQSMEKEADETTPVAQQRSVGMAGTSSSSPAPGSFPSTPPARADSGFRRPALPGQKGNPPRHSTPKMSGRPRDSFGAAFNNISIIANTSLHAPPPSSSSGSNGTRSIQNTRKTWIESRGVADASMDEGDKNGEDGQGGQEGQDGQEVAAVNGTFVIDEASVQNGTFVVNGEEREEREEEGGEGQGVHVRVEAIGFRRSAAPRDVTMASMDGGETGETGERVHVVALTMTRQQPPPPPAAASRVPPPSSRASRSSFPRDATMMSIDEDENEENEGRSRDERDQREEESREIEDVEMESMNETPVRRQSIRPAKRPSIEHPITATSSPMAIQISQRSSGLRETMMKPRVSQFTAVTNGRKISTASSSGSAIPLEEISQNLSLTSSEQSYEDAKTPERTPKTTRLLRQSLAARDARQSKQPRLSIMEECDVREEEEDEEEEEMEIATRRRIENGGQRRETTTPTTPVNKLPALSQRLQSSVDRLSQPRHRPHSTQPCARLSKLPSPSRGPGQKAIRSSISSPSPTRRFTPSNQPRGIIAGYTPNHRIDTTLMEDDGVNAKSGMAPRIKRIGRRDIVNKKGTGTLNVTMEELDVEERRATRGNTVSQVLPSALNSPVQIKDSSRYSAVSSSPITSSSASANAALALQHDDQHSFDDNDDGYREEEDNPSMGGRAPPPEDEEEEDSVFARRTNTLAVTPRSSNHRGRRSAISGGGGGRRSLLSDSDGTDDMDRLSSRASQISIDDAMAGGTGRGRAAAAAAAMSNESFGMDSPLRRDDPMAGRGTGGAGRGRGRSAAAAAAAAKSNESFGMDSPLAAPSPKTPFRRTVASNSDLFSTDTPGIDRGRGGLTPTLMDTEEEDEWAANQESQQWRGDVTTEEDENEASNDISQTSIIEEEDVDERVLAPRKLIAPTASPGVRRSTRTRMKPVRSWLGEQAQYEMSPRSGALNLVGVNRVVIKDKLFVKTGTADITKAVEAKKKTQKQRGIANKKKREQRRAQQEEESE